MIISEPGCFAYLCGLVKKRCPNRTYKVNVLCQKLVPDIHGFIKNHLNLSDFLSLKNKSLAGLFFFFKIMVFKFISKILMLQSYVKHPWMSLIREYVWIISQGLLNEQVNEDVASNPHDFKSITHLLTCFDQKHQKAG